MEKSELFPAKEKSIEDYLYNQIKAIGGWAVKMSIGGGFPDRMILYKGWCGFVETKRPGKTYRIKQRAMKKILERLGFTVSLCDTKQLVDEYIDNLKTYVV